MRRFDHSIRRQTWKYTACKAGTCTVSLSPSSRVRGRQRCTSPWRMECNLLSILLPQPLVGLPLLLDRDASVVLLETAGLGGVFVRKGVFPFAAHLFAALHAEGSSGNGFHTFGRDLLSATLAGASF